MKISVIIPVLNNVKTIEKAILSVINQKYENLELIVLDAGSHDGTVDIIQKYASSIYYWHSQPDGGAYLALNRGAEIATGDLIAQLMADDWFEPGLFAAIEHATTHFPEGDIYSCGGRFVTFDPLHQNYNTFKYYQTPENLRLDFYNVCFGIPAMSSRFVKKKLINKIGLFKPIDPNGDTLLSADREFLLRAIIHNAKNVIVKHLGHTYFAHEHSATFGKSRTIQIKICQEHMQIAENYLSRGDVSSLQQRVLKYWYIDQSVRFILFRILALDFSCAWPIIKKGVKKLKLRWLIALYFIIPVKIFITKMYHIMR